MKVGDTVYFVENRSVRKAEVFKLTGDFVTLRFQYRDPNSGPGKDVYHDGGLRLRKKQSIRIKGRSRKKHKVRKQNQKLLLFYRLSYFLSTSDVTFKSEK